MSRPIQRLTTVINMDTKAALRTFTNRKSQYRPRPGVARHLVAAR